MFVILFSSDYYIHNLLENSLTYNCIYLHRVKLEEQLRSKTGKQYFVFVLEGKLMGLPENSLCFL